MKIAVVTSIIGNIDNKKEFLKQNVPCEFHFFNDIELENINVKNKYIERIKSKAPKFQTHKLIPDFDIYVWLDGSFEIVSDKFVGYLLGCLGDNDLWIKKHDVTNCVYHEGNFILENMENKKAHFHKYFNNRFDKEDIKREIAFYRSVNFPKQSGMWQGGIFIRRNNFLTNLFFDRVFAHCLNFSPKDQLGLAFHLLTTKINFSDADIPCNEKIIHHHRHASGN